MHHGTSAQVGGHAVRRLFAYNWAVRREWLDWSGGMGEADLLRARAGGQGSILKTLFHVVDVEWSWLRFLSGLPDFDEPFERYATLEAVRALDHRFHPAVVTLLDAALERPERLVAMPWDEGQRYPASDVLRHALAHEIHHVGQLSVWARELGLAPVSADLLDHKGFSA